MMKQSLGLQRRDVYRRILPSRGRFLSTASMFGLINRRVIILGRFVRFWRLARDRNLLVQLGYMFRYNAGFQFILDWANSGKLGDIFSVRGRISSSISSEAHWQRWDSLGEHSGGIMFILACHLTDIIVALLGRPTRVTTLFEARRTRRAVVSEQYGGCI